MRAIDFIPQTLKALPQWVVWKKQDGKKLPYSPNYNGLASSVNPKSWSDFDGAVKKFQTGGFDGLGFVFTKSDNLVFIDLDHCVDAAGQFSSLAKNIIEHFNDVYIELSQSGSGVHIICKGKIPKSVKTKKVEIYDSGRYVALTGKALYGIEPKEKQSEINVLWNWLQRKREGNRITPTGSGVAPSEITLSAAEIVWKASQSKGGEVFDSLYSGDWKGLGIGDGTQSAADLSFANRLSFWCGCDKKLMEEIFRSSGLYRNQRKMNLALDRALANCGTTYNGGWKDGGAYRS